MHGLGATQIGVPHFAGLGPHSPSIAARTKSAWRSTRGRRGVAAWRLLDFFIARSPARLAGIAFHQPLAKKDMHHV